MSRLVTDVVVLPAVASVLERRAHRAQRILSRSHLGDRFAAARSWRSCSTVRRRPYANIRVVLCAKENPHETGSKKGTVKIEGSVVRKLF